MTRNRKRRARGISDQLVAEAPFDAVPFQMHQELRQTDGAVETISTFSPSLIEWLVRMQQNLLKVRSYRRQWR